MSGSEGNHLGFQLLVVGDADLVELRQASEVVILVDFPRVQSEQGRCATQREKVAYQNFLGSEIHKTLQQQGTGATDLGNQ